MSRKVQPIELLSPAKDLACGKAAVNHGADAVYVGGPDFSARSAAANSYEDIEKLIQYAHIYGCKVYVALNTLLYDDEIDTAVSGLRRYHDMGADGAIIQDMGLLQCDLPPIPLHASTQVDNRTVEKITFLEKVGFQQVVLARELHLDDIRKIHQKTNVTLEFFIHGALCASFSGRCFISQVMTGRSANRGKCAQLCRHRFSLVDAGGNILEKDQFLLSQKDLNLSTSIEPLLEAGVRSFKIEGRLKNQGYVKNITAFYRQRFDDILHDHPEYAKGSSGSCTYPFVPDLQKSFHRGSTSNFLHNQKNKVIEPRTPKSIGEKIGKISKRKGSTFELDTKLQLNNGDGLCYFDGSGHLMGIRVNSYRDNIIHLHKETPPPVGTVIFRNFDAAFDKQLKNSQHCRKIDIQFCLQHHSEGICLVANDEDGIQTSTLLAGNFAIAQKQQKVEANIRECLTKTGSTPFLVKEISISADPIPFLPLSELNELRRRCLTEHLNKREEKYLSPRTRLPKNSSPYPPSELNTPGNVTNEKAAEFFRAHGVKHLALETESELQGHDLDLMTMRHCLRYQLGMCSDLSGEMKHKVKEPLFLVDNVGRYQLHFDCKKCQMKLRLPLTAEPE